MEKSKIFQELESLLDLAEKTSDKAIVYNKEARSRNTKQLLVGLALFFTFIIFIFLSLESYMKEEVQIVGGFVFVFCAVISAFFIYFQNRIVRELKRKNYIEKEVLKELLSMIDDVRKIVYNDNLASNIDKAVIDMRLKRISFSAETI